MGMAIAYSIGCVLLVSKSFLRGLVRVDLGDVGSPWFCAVLAEEAKGEARPFWGSHDSRSRTLVQTKHPNDSAYRFSSP